MLRTRLLWVSLAVAVTAAVPARAQSVSDSDFFSISSVEVGLFAERQFEVQISVNTKTPLMTMVFPLSYAGHPDLRVDRNVGDQGVTFEGLGNLSFWNVRSALLDTAQKTVLIGLVSFINPMPPSVGRVAAIHFRLDSSDVPGVVYVDSTFVPPANRLSFVDENAFEYTPQFTRGVIDITDQVPVIGLSVTRLDFQAFVDSLNPPARGFLIFNDGGGTLHWKAASTRPWLAVAPGSGTGDANVLASVEMAGLPVGRHTAYIEVTDSAAINSPKLLPVILYVVRHPDPADSDYVYVSTAVAPTNQRSKTSVDVFAGATRWLDAMVIPLTFADDSLLRVDTTAGEKGVTWRILGNDPAWDVRVFSVDKSRRTATIGLIRFTQRFTPGEGPVATIHFAVDSTVVPDTVVIDSTFVPPTNHLVFADSNSQFIPAFHAGAVILEPFHDSLCVTPPELHLFAGQNDPLLPCGKVIVENCGGITLWSTSTGNPCGAWLDCDVNKTGDSLVIDVCALTADLDTGMHVCSLSVWAERMSNSPVKIPVYYRIAPPPPPEVAFECNLVARDLGSGMWDQAALGTDFGATDGYDPGRDLFKAPPPPGGHVRVAFFHPEWGLIDDDFAYDIRAPFAEGCKEWLVKVETTQPGTMHLQAACPRPAGHLRWALCDVSGVVLAPDFDVHGYTYPAAPGAQMFVLRLCGGGVFEAAYPAGWSLMSSPLEPPDPGMPAVFGPEVDLWQFYGWENGSYFVPTEFHGCGMAYWMLLPEPRKIEIRGEPCGPPGAPVCLDLNAGWNLVGDPFMGASRLSDARVDSAGLQVAFGDAFARGLLSPALWGWTNASYLLYQAMTPGAGYWVPALVDGLSLCLFPFIGGAEPMLREDFVGIAFAGTDVRVRVGLRETAHDGFDAGLDLPLPPDGPAEVDYWLGISSSMHPLFAYYYQDVRRSGTRVEWPLQLRHPGAATLHFENTRTLIEAGYFLSIMNVADSESVLIEGDGDMTVTGTRYLFIAEALPTGTNDTRPWSYYLAANQPNPFNPETKIGFGLAAAGRVDLSIYNVLGQKVRTLVEQDYAAGEYAVIWDGRDDRGREVPSGVYFYRIVAADFTVARKMVLLR